MQNKCTCKDCKQRRRLDDVCRILTNRGYSTQADSLNKIYEELINKQVEDKWTIFDLIADIDKLKIDIAKAQKQKEELQKETEQEFAALEDAYEDLIETTKEQKTKVENLRKELERYKVALDNADKTNTQLKKQLEDEKAKQPHPGDVKMGFIIKKAYQDLQAAELEKTLLQPKDYNLPKSTWH